MSRDAMNLVWSIGRNGSLSSGVRLVFTCLADHHNPRTDQCNPSYPTIAKKVGLAEATVKEHTAKLRELGLIDWTTGGNRSNQYWFPGLKNPNLSSGTPDDTDSDLSSGGAADTVIDEKDSIVGYTRPLSSGTPDANLVEQGPSRNRTSQITNGGKIREGSEFAEKDWDASTGSLYARDGDPTPEHLGSEHPDECEPFFYAGSQTDLLPDPDPVSTDPQELIDPLSDAEWEAYQSAIQFSSICDIP